MKRQVITIQEDMVIYAPHHGEVWMTVWEIAELLNVTALVNMYCAFLNADRGIKNSAPVCFKRIFYRITAFVKNYIHNYHLPFILSQYKKNCNKKNKIYKEIAKNK